MNNIGTSVLLATLKILKSILLGVDFEHLRKRSANIVKVGKFKTQMEAPLSS